MKKSVILIISCLCLVSIVFVAFFGVKSLNVEPVRYIESVEIVDINMGNIGGGKDPETPTKRRTLNLEFIPDGVDENGEEIMSYYFNTIIIPEDTTSRAVLYSTLDNPYIEVTNPRGAIIIREKENLRPFSTQIKCSANDGSPRNPKDDIYLRIDYSK